MVMIHPVFEKKSALLHELPSKHTGSMPSLIDRLSQKYVIVRIKQDVDLERPHGEVSRFCEVVVVVDLYM